MKRFFLSLGIIVATFGALTSCGSDAKKDEPVNPKDPAIVGTWQVTDFYSDGYYTSVVNKEIYNFTAPDKFLYTYHHSQTLIDTVRGKYTWNEGAQTVFVEEPRGWNLNIVVEFKDTNNAVFHQAGRWGTRTKQVKVKRIK